MAVTSLAKARSEAIAAPRGSTPDVTEAFRWAQEAWAKGPDVGVVVPAGKLLELIALARATRR